MFLVVADENHQNGIEEGKQLVESKINCDELTNEQLEKIGEYYMEQMHQGESHEAMHERMGMEEGTDYHEKVHVNMAKMIYCGNSKGIMSSSGGMMPMMMGFDSMTGNNMMGNSIGGSLLWLFGWIFIILVLIVLVLLIVWLIKQIQREK